ncbi:hypothetical protein BTR14_02010 [Rhizobium rhizosphaerae]|uniref:Calcineurin-like phosphoesterase domain-containing protein n=1 Tax=Xaviernesmea rhizosphaerae TaxID=1672749 RepID=A0ABX3PJJ1_9HYPH|nr:metallophosphoesterase family protein [Xaviernesmea rhizosphaerae]OQP88247.1 hypothetical protein BTR14_02010 [Xaviernesmea rhizosphaerae]
MAGKKTFAVIADIHGNLLALDAVLADIDRQGIGGIINLGDHLSGPLDPSGTAERLMQRPMMAIRGNHDRHLLTIPPDAMGPSDRFAAARLTDGHRAWLASLPATLDLGDVFACHARPQEFACHARPQEDDSYLLEEVQEDGTVLPRSLPEIATLLDGIRARVVLSAHSHCPRLLRLDDSRFVLNPGSVGCPAYQDETPYPHRMETGHPVASYAVIGWTPAGDLDVTFRHVAYDHLAASAQAARNGRPDWAEALRTGRIGRG